VKKPPKIQATWLRITRYTHHLVVGITVVGKVKCRNMHWSIEVLGTPQSTTYLPSERERAEKLVEEIAAERVAALHEAFGKGHRRAKRPAKEG
jgi:hypothetical protein